MRKQGKASFLLIFARALITLISSTVIKLKRYNFLDGEGWKGSYSCVQAGWSCMGGLSTIPQFRVHSLFSYNFILSMVIHVRCQSPAPAHSWSIGQSCQSFGFSWEQAEGKDSGQSHNGTKK